MPAALVHPLLSCVVVAGGHAVLSVAANEGSVDIMSRNAAGLELRKIQFVGTYLPRQCGIATFTHDLCESVAGQAPHVSVSCLAMNDREEGYDYPSRIAFEIEENKREQYDVAADYVNLSQPSLICVQHEFGIFGGKRGRHVLSLLQRVRAPIVATLHTVLREPTTDELQILQSLAELSERLVVMSERAIEFLVDIYGVDRSKIELIHHGIPDLPFIDPNFYKDKFGVEGRRVLLSSGLLHPGKGLEYAIEAMSRVVQDFPDAHYLILGATHPAILREQGEEYRQLLQRKARELRLGQHVSFVNRFVTREELCEYLGAADIYVTPYLLEAQITSGALSYAMGAGKAVVSTPYWHAAEALAEDRGRLVPFADAEALADAFRDLLSDATQLHAVRKRAYQYCRDMTWTRVAERYLDLFARVRRERNRRPRPARTSRPAEPRFDSLPELNVNHMRALTDDTGILQHAHYSVPDRRHGYSTDDQARALIVAVKSASLRPERIDWNRLAARYLSYLVYAFDEESRRFGNFMSYQRTWTRPMATEDVHARAVWSLAYVVACSRKPGQAATAADLMDRAVQPLEAFQSPRAWAYSVLAILTYLRRYPGASRYRRELETLARRLHEQRRRGGDSTRWPWPEDTLTYDNARIPQVMIEAGRFLEDHDMRACGLETLRWLDRLQTSDGGHFTPVGSHGWYPRNGKRARFDQQPIEAAAHLEASVSAYRTTGEETWLEAAQRAFDWFLGRNDLGLSLCDLAEGACYDGLQADGVNHNQGAESTLCWLLSLLAMYEIQDEAHFHTITEESEVAA